LAPAIGAKARDSVTQRTRRYTEGEIGDLRVVDDFLPPPGELVLREDTVKVTLAAAAWTFSKGRRGKPKFPISA
jgi:hypothetical protein